MDKILLDMQSGLFAKAIQRTLSQELDNYQVIISEHPDKTVQHCKTFKPYALLMEATGYTPWMLFIGWSGRCGSTPDLPKENKNPYSVGNKKNRAAEKSEAGQKQSETTVNHTGDMR